MEALALGQTLHLQGPDSGARKRTQVTGGTARATDLDMVAGRMIEALSLPGPHDHLWMTPTGLEMTEIEEKGVYLKESVGGPGLDLDLLTEAVEEIADIVGGSGGAHIHENDHL